MHDATQQLDPSEPAAIDFGPYIGRTIEASLTLAAASLKF